MSIVLVGLPDSDIVPGSYLQINWGVGLTGLGTAPLKALIIGNWISTSGTGAANTVYGPDTSVPANTADDFANLAGARAEAAYMANWWFKSGNNSTPLYGIFTPESTGVAATASLTFALIAPASAATASGYCRIWINGAEFTDVPISKGDSLSTICTNAVSYLSAMASWPITASASSPSVTLTAAQKGVRGNNLHVQARVYPADGSVGISVTPTTSTAFTGGTLNDTWTTALAAILGIRYYYIVSADDGQGTGLTALQAQVDSDALPATGNRQRFVFGSTQSTANTTTITTTLNDVRGECVAQPGGDILPCALAAHAAAHYALLESQTPLVCNFDGVGTQTIGSLDTTQSWKIPGLLSGAKLTHSQILSGLTAGQSIVQTLSSGKSSLTKRVTTKFLTAGQFDFRTRDSHKVTVCDRFGDDVRNDYAVAIAGKVMGNRVQPNQRQPNNTLFTPDQAEAIAKFRVQQYDALGLLQSVDQTLASISSSRSTTAPTRMTTVVNLYPVDVVDQAGTVINQSSI